MMARRDHPYRRKLLPGQTCRVMTYDVDTGATAEVYRSDDILLEAPNWTAPGTLVLNGDGILWTLDLATGTLADRDVPALPFLNNDHVPGPDCKPFYVSGYDWHIHAVDLDTGETRQVTRDDPNRPMFHFLHGVSPSGDELAFVGIEPTETGNPWGPANIYTIPSSGGALRQLTFGDKPADGSEYSPDGAWIYFNTEAFSSERGHSQIARVLRAGGTSEQLTFDERVNWFPHLSPDGRLACYLSYPPGTVGHPENLPVELKLVRDHLWTEAETVAAILGGQGTINVNSWSPDSRSFAFVEYPLASHAGDLDCQETTTTNNRAGEWGTTFTDQDKSRGWKRRWMVGNIYKIALLIATSSLPGVAAAQDGTSQDGASQPGFGEIIVTAQRREESLQKVPLSVTAVTADVLEDRHFTDPAQLQFIAPNLQFTSFALAPGATNFSVRGIGTASFSHLIEPSVATVIDGVVLGRPEMGVMQFSDLERVEILAGPQGMLFGKNASAGLINIVTRKPQLGESTLEAHSEVGIVNAAKKCCSVVFQATGNVPLGETAAFRLNGYFTEYQGLVKDVFPNPGSDYGHKEYGFKPKLLWEPTEEFSLLIAGDFAHGTGIGTGAITPRSVAPNSPLLPYQIEAGIVAGPDNLLRSSNAANNVKFDVGGVQATASYTFENGIMLSNIVGWRKYNGSHIFDADYHQISALDLVSAKMDFEQFTEEFRISSGSDGRLEYQAGLFMYWGQTNRSDYASVNLAIGTPPEGLVNWAGMNAYDNLKSKSYAVYGQATYKITDQFRLTAGGRYTWDRLRDVAHIDNDGFAFGFAAPADYVQRYRSKDFSWRVSAQYDFTPDVMAYATASTGYKGPGFNQVYGGGAPIGPEHSKAYEVGLKSRLGENVLFNLALYWEEVDDLQIQTFVPEIPAYLTSNAGSLRSRGIEAELRVKAATDFTISANASYNDATFTSFERALCYPGQTAATGCVSDPENPGSTFTDASGNRLQNAPKFSGTIGIDYTPALSDTLDGFLHADLYGRTSVNFSANGNPATTQEGYVLANASAGFGPASEAWKVSVFCRNCFDQRFITFMESNPGGIAGDYGQTFGLTSFRTIGLGVDLKL